MNRIELGLLSDVERLKLEISKSQKELDAKIKECKTYMKQYQKELAIRLKIKKLANKED
jgi:hypothetical protein